MQPPDAARGRGARVPAGARLSLCALLVAAVLVPVPARALQVGGALSWDLARTESDGQYSDVVQESFGQSYRVNLSGAVGNRRIGGWNGGLGWREDETAYGGTSQPNRKVTLTTADFGVLALPGTLPIQLNLRRSTQETAGAAPATQQTTTTTASLSTRVPLPDGNPLGVSAYQSTQDPGTGTSRSRLVSLNKRFDLTRDTNLDSAYQFSNFDAPSGDSTGHGVSLSSHTSWSERVSSTMFGNVTSRTSTATRSATGRSLFLNNSAGANVYYRRGREASGSLSYSYTESPQDQTDDIQSHMLAGRGNVRVSKKTDVAARFTARRLDLPAVTLDTATATMSLTHRPLFGWSTGGTVGLAKNRTDGPTTTDRDTYTASGFLNARHDLAPVQIDWGGNLAYATSRGDFGQDRVTTSAHLGARERRLQTVRVSGNYRFTDIQEDRGGGLDPFTRDHGITATADVVPVRGLWFPTDVINGGVTGSVHWSRQYRPDRAIRTTTLTASAKYVPTGGVVTTASVEMHDNSSDPGGANEILRGSASWTRRAFERGSVRFSGDYRRTWAGGEFEAQEAKLGLNYDYSVGLLRVSLAADATFVGLGGSTGGTDTTHVRLNIVRNF